jgi:CBS-domain-containing membrane protein
MSNVPALLSLTAADLMTRVVVTIPSEMSLQGAARLLSRARVSGAPVVDSDGHCIGVLSAMDFVTWAEKGRAAAKGKAPVDIYSAWQVVDIDDLPDDRVCHHMTADPVIVDPSTSIGELAQMMLDAHIHRLIVVQQHNRPVGIVSSTDVLAAVARAARLMTQPVPG